MARIYIRNKRELCKLDLPFDKTPITYNIFTMPEGSIVKERDVSGAIFSPYIASVDESDANYCIAQYPEKFNIELNKFREVNGVTFRDRVVASPREVYEAIKNSDEIAAEKRQQAEIKENELSQEKSKALNEELEKGKEKEKDRDIGEELE